MPKGLVVGDTSLGRERDLVPSLPGGGEREVLLVLLFCVGVWSLAGSSIC
jgi:hypothetical protein